MSRTRTRSIRKTPPAAAEAPGSLALRRRAIGAATPFDTWPEPAVRRLASASHLLRYRRGSRLLFEGEIIDFALLIAHGAIEVSISRPDGRQFTYALGWQGAVFGLLPMFDGRGMPHDMNALEAVTAVKIPFAAIRAELDAAPALWQSFAYDMAWRFRNLFDIVHGTALDPAPVRLASALLRLARNEGKAVPEGIAIKVRLSQERVGELIGVTRQTAMLHLHDLEASGLIAWRYGRATVLDMEALQAMASERNPVQPPAKT